MRPLSSTLTFFYKFLFPVCWLVVCLTAFWQASSGSTVSNSQWIMLLVGIGGAFSIVLITGKVKQVTLNDGVLQVSNFFRTIEVPVSEIKAVSGTSLLSPTLVWFELKQPSAMGDRITFMPRARMKPGIGKHPLVHELHKEFGLQ